MTFESDITEAGLFDSYELQMEQKRHECEVRDLVKRYYPNGRDLAAYFELVEKKRGRVATEKLRADCRKEWARYRDELTSQA